MWICKSEQAKESKIELPGSLKISGPSQDSKSDQLEHNLFCISQVPV